MVYINALNYLKFNGNQINQINSCFIDNYSMYADNIQYNTYSTKRV